jgi:hypothetical protein
MYDVGVALRRFKGLIKWAARKYEISGNYSMSARDLEAEGLLLLVQCCRGFPEGQILFARYFKRALYNRLQQLHATNHRQKRQGIEVELGEALELPTLEESEDWKRIRMKANVLLPVLSPTAQRFLKELLEPSESTVEFAWRDFCRKNKLHSQGLRTTGWSKFRIKFRHIRGALGMSRVDMRTVTRELRRKTREMRRGKLL